ncbi:alpha/beta hydrolase [Mucilaginibacter robiniae]|uniref:Alpha/beta hydrolase n=1 Tax=Mucilaginibacter robiniae TaxID=2728022 RepID=A0A7L5DXY3_9SPHI|nr:alpha/beta fold hydrolase [Mucilaginibacter robiniae]QJD94889.1 alpha/beta hydrolase [Mucilaginibacter robiniae]
MKKLFITLTLIIIAFSLHAQSLVGTWYGTLNVQGNKIPLVFHINKTGDAYTGSMDSPTQGANGLPATATAVTGNQITIDLAKFGIKYVGTYHPDSNQIAGNFLQGGGSFPLNLSANKPLGIKSALAARPQDPTSFPYHREDVTFTNPKAGNRLAGTLTLPPNGKASKIVVFITGSGPENRNEEIAQYNHRPFLVWSDWLTRQGIATLRYDDRGIDQSTGDYATATTADLADDAEAAVNYIHSRTDLKQLTVGLIGHSEGGMIAPMVASRNANVKFLVLLAGPGVPINELMVQQNASFMRLAGTPADVIQRNEATNQKLYAAAKQYQNLPDSAFKAQLATVLYQDFHNYPAGALGNNKLEDVVNSSVNAISNPWFRYFITFKPADYLTKIKCPVLAINGTLDMQVNSTTNLAAIKTNLQKAGNKNHQEVAMLGLNHLFQQAKTGSTTEYSEITETANPAALQKVSSWINQLSISTTKK